MNGDVIGGKHRLKAHRGWSSLPAPTIVFIHENTIIKTYNYLLSPNPEYSSICWLILKIMFSWTSDAYNYESLWRHFISFSERKKKSIQNKQELQFILWTNIPYKSYHIIYFTT